MKRVVLLGSTGSIGVNTLKVLSGLRGYALCGLTAGSNWQLALRQIRKHSPKLVAMADEKAAERLAHALRSSRVKILRGEDGIRTVAAMDGADIVVSAILGAAGLRPNLDALAAGKRLALANKESLVMAGEAMMAAARRYHTEIIPIDSEHSAVFQAFHSGRREEVRKVTLTASGGPFANHHSDRLHRVTPRDALNHPTWKMGAKITVDSATLMNKALEVIEARWLFDLKPEQIEVLVHPQSIIHSLVEFTDGSVIAQMGPPDMKIPIQYALTYPRRLKGNGARLDLAEVKSLTFQKPDTEKFPSIRLGYEVVRRGGTLGAVLNAANEVAVKAFLDKRCAFPDITATVAAVMKEHRSKKRPTLDDVLAAARWATARAESLLALERNG
ncbi:MAG: 1-deoxy-D-xylulose-5-phosphate reductoisomerase [Planctomycetes bacterium RBG_16_59_8]|nr:MAG: 1-deoxy-D-xylulose-5-phosphate reductoisomerase [Planctomycetes bacterium RBG_16_59_8]